MKIQKNLGTFDRVARIAAGAFLLLLVPLAFVGPESRWALFGIMGVFPLIAGAAGFCPRYAIVGINTYKGHEEQGGKEADKYRTQACC